MRYITTHASLILNMYISSKFGIINYNDLLTNCATHGVPTKNTYKVKDFEIKIFYRPPTNCDITLQTVFTASST